MKHLFIIAAICGTHPAFSQATDSATIFFNKGNEEMKAGRFLPASKAFENAVKYNPSFTEAYLQNGFAALQMRKVNLALNNFEKVYALEPNNPQAIKELTEIYYNYRKLDKAIEFANKCTQCSNASFIKGMSYYRKEDYGEAVKHLQHALKLDPANAEALYTIGRSYLDMDEYSKAIPFYEKAAELENANSTWIYELALLSYNVGNYKNSVKYFAKAAEKGYTQSNDFDENYGFASFYAGNYDKGEELIKEVWRKKPGNKEILRDAAEALYKKGQYDRSLMYCQKLMELDNNDAKALYQAGLNFIKKGPKEKGEKMCDKAIEMDSSLSNLRQKQEMPW